MMKVAQKVYVNFDEIKKDILPILLEHISKEVLITMREVLREDSSVYAINVRLDFMTEGEFKEFLRRAGEVQNESL